MKRKRSEKRLWKFSEKPSHYPYRVPFILVGLIPATIGVAHVYRVPARFVVPLVVLDVWITASLLLWQYASTHASGNEWWQ